MRQYVTLSALLLGLIAAPTVARAQSAIIYGSVQNFDISNDTGLICHGFEVDIVGETLPQSAMSFSAERYGLPTDIPYAGGMAVRWESPYNKSSQTYGTRTLPHTVTWFPGQCYQWNPATYENSGCEHFGTARGATSGGTRALARWLCEDANNLGVLAAIDPPTAVPYPTYSVQPPAAPAAWPVVVMEIQAPDPAEAVDQYGEATWMRVFVTELPREVNLDELVADNPAVVPMDPAQLESNWDLMQADPLALGPQGKHSQKRNGRILQLNSRAVVRRIETWEYTGAYDAASHLALCADLTCTTPAANEVGVLISTQMSAVNVQADSLTVTKSGTGGGNVDSSDKRIACGNKCVSPYIGGTLVTLTAKANSGSSFSGWTGACAAQAGLTCSVLANGHVDVGAIFTANPAGGGGGGGGTSTTYKISISKNGKGTVASSPAAASYAAGTVVTLTATPDPGSPWVGWGGACSGIAPTCTVTMNSNLSVTANFR
jgi:hypothetical protein